MEDESAAITGTLAAKKSAEVRKAERIVENLILQDVYAVETICLDGSNRYQRWLGLNPDTTRRGVVIVVIFCMLAANKGPGTTRVTLWTLCRANRGFLKDGESRRRGRLGISTRRQRAQFDEWR